MGPFARQKTETRRRVEQVEMGVMEASQVAREAVAALAAIWEETEGTVAAQVVEGGVAVAALVEATSRRRAAHIACCVLQADRHR